MALPEDLVPHLERLRTTGDQPEPLFDVDRSDPMIPGLEMVGEADRAA